MSVSHVITCWFISKVEFTRSCNKNKVLMFKYVVCLFCFVFLGIYVVCCVCSRAKEEIQTKAELKNRVRSKTYICCNVKPISNATSDQQKRLNLKIVRSFRYSVVQLEIYSLGTYVYQEIS